LRCKNTTKYQISKFVESKKQKAVSINQLAIVESKKQKETCLAFYPSKLGTT